MECLCIERKMGSTDEMSASRRNVTGVEHESRSILQS